VGEQWRSQVVDAGRLQRHGEAAPPVPGGKDIEFVSCCRTIEGDSLRILDPQGKTLPEGRVGEIELRGLSVAGGYFGDPAATAHTFPRGALRTGDLGYLSGGHLFVTGRQRDLVIVHGRNYAAQTIEWALDGLPLVRPGNSVAFSYPDAAGSEQVAIVCESASREKAAVRHSVAARVSENLGLPVGQILVVRPGTLPKTSSGKVQRARTRPVPRRHAAPPRAHQNSRARPPRAAAGTGALAGGPGIGAVPPGHWPPAPAQRRASMTGGERIALVRDIVERVSERPLGDVGPDTRLADLGVDSITFAEVVVQLEEALGIDIPFARWLTARIVRDVLTMIDEAVPQQAPRSGAGAWPPHPLP
jgi:acyl carrier protein